MKCEDCKKYKDCIASGHLVWPCGAYRPVVVTNADRIRAMSDEGKRTALIEYFSDWVGVGDSYIYDLTRVKTAFSVGTVDLDDFEEWGEERVAQLVNEFLDWLQQPAEGVPRNG